MSIFSVAHSPWSNVRRAMRLVGWNLFLIIIGLLLIGLVGEVYFRLTIPFLNPHQHPWRFVSGVGLLYGIDEEVRLTNDLDYWTVQRTNSLGFLDREPINPVRAAESCHITVIGDSYVQASQVPIYDKLHVNLEEIAANENPDLDITTSAFAVRNTGQVNQLPFYEGYARHLSPDLVVLVFVENDFADNSTFFYALRDALHPHHMPLVHVARNLDGSIELGMPDPDFEDFGLRGLGERRSQSSRSWIVDVTRDMRSAAIRYSRFVNWTLMKLERYRASRQTSSLSFDDYTENNPKFIARTEYLIGLPEYAFLSDVKMPRNLSKLWPTLRSELWQDSNSILSREMWDNIKFALNQFKRRVDHDGVKLLVLTESDIGGKGSPVFDQLVEVGASLDISVISQHDYIINQGGRVKDAHWANDGHWTSIGHRWAAGAIWEYIKEEWDGECPITDPNPDIEVDWVPVGRHFHTSDGDVWVNSFPDLNPEGYESVYNLAISDHPVARSDWDVHLYEDGLTYIKEPCFAKDSENRFFLHVFSKDMNNFPKDVGALGFDNLDFNFYDRGEFFDGKCIASVDLPDYDIATIRTGQVANDSEIWSVYYNFALPDIMESLDNLQQSDRKPNIRSNFDVYIDDGRLLYAKDSCSTNDHDIPFFLHVFPTDENDLPDARKESGFDNLDFELMQKGGESDGACFAAVDLPKYDIASIRTGQWLRDEGNLWEASINFGEQQ